MAPSPAPHDRPGYAELTPATSSASAAPTLSHAASSPSVPRISAHSATTNAHAPTRRTASGSPTTSAQPPKSSPPSATRHASGSTAPRIIVKKEPGSPELPAPRHRPRKLDLSKNAITGSGAQTARLPGGRDGLGIQEVGLACLSPGFVTHDPAMKEQLQRSMNVREQQRHLIEARLQQQSAKGDGPDHPKDKDNASQFAAKTPGISSRRNKAPPGLSIVAPSHEQFANERVIQSAPLGQTFTGRHNPHPLTRHLQNQPSNLSSTSHIHHVPAQQTANRLPPIADVFGQGLSAHTESNGATRSLYPGSSHGPIPSPGHPAPQHSQPPVSGRSREYKSAEEVQQELAGGRPELLPKIVHYTGHQPPTPPSPRNGAPVPDYSRSTSKRRTRAEYEEGGSPPLGNGPAATRRAGPFGAGRDSPESQRAKREEFLRLCERAWDLFHS
ncbi:uncharacterized protein BCR38DRAFT_333290 [Pseudomassariella vexata]|uniref:Uncharacterized protein n=1 Tax=Pseudomassariella vexata TaxID=1141098 RepID=A0A1Y2EEC6_9PEZI|nr:uncharacterized protein BCR38DRAFT_333290 [Pseudomassariella vexata]ORY69933.1 hypothetical protein BCR38DRAFT_333290 [Pseudomassariella vexata]